MAGAAVGRQCVTLCFPQGGEPADAFGSAGIGLSYPSQVDGLGCVAPVHPHQGSPDQRVGAHLRLAGGFGHAHSPIRPP